jgi:hypothetical protein
MDHAEVAREVNRQIAEMSARLNEDEALEVRFMCECGCLSWVTMTAKRYAAEGAWRNGHAAPLSAGEAAARD